MSTTDAPRKERFQATISVLTPLHTGQGELLHRNVDYLIHEGHLLVFRLTGLEQEFGAAALADQPAFRLAALGSGEKLAGLAAYRLALPPRTQMPTEVQAYLRDAFEQPYVPSSLLRSALAVAVRRQQHQVEQDAHSPVGAQHAAPESEPAASAEEKTTDESTPPAQPPSGGGQQRGRRRSYADPLRALTVTDCYPSADDLADGLLRLLETGTRGQGDTPDRPNPPGAGAAQARRPGGAPQQPERVWLECLPPQATLTGTVTLDPRRLTASQRHAPAAGPGGVAEIIAACQSWSEQVMNAEHEWWRQQPAAQSVVAVYDALQAHRAHAARDALSTLLWLGWGTRWHAAPAAASESQGSTGPRATGERARRQVILSGSSRPAGPLGWVRLTLHP
ncbi:MAG: hypothetical protein OXU67_03860 [Chloroflexota bacterium]|nr:hypothetical protein [Chloroflexota bacterium]